MTSPPVPEPTREAPLLLTAIVLGATAGALAAAALYAMHAVQHLVWAGDVGPLRIAVTILVGGTVIAALRYGERQEESLEEILAAAQDPISWHWRRTARLTALSVTAVAFGGAVGPEAGLVAIVTELSSIVTRRIARAREHNRQIGQIGTAATLAGLYGSPPAGAAWSDDTLSSRTVTHLGAAAAGFLAFLTIHHLTSGGTVDMGIAAVHRSNGNLALSLVPALAGAALAALYAMAQGPFRDLLRRLPGGPMTHTLTCTAAFAALAAAIPAARFSGHEQLSEIADLASHSAWGTLAVVAGCKLLATTFCLRGGWLGGDIFPLLFAGAAAGVATTALLPSLDLGSATVAGLTASAVIGLRKPVAAFLVCIFVAGGDAWGPLAVALVVGMVAARRLPASPHH